MKYFIFEAEEKQEDGRWEWFSRQEFSNEEDLLDCFRKAVRSSMHPLKSVRLTARTATKKLAKFVRNV